MDKFEQEILVNQVKQKLNIVRQFIPKPEIQKSLNPFDEYEEDVIEKGKKAELGEVRYYGGIPYRKVSSTGNANKDWQRAKDMPKKDSKESNKETEKKEEKSKLGDVPWETSSFSSLKEGGYGLTFVTKDGKKSIKVDKGDVEKLTSGSAAEKQELKKKYFDKIGGEKKESKPGDTTEHKGKKYKKQANGKWLEVSEHEMTKKEHTDKVNELASKKGGELGYVFHSKKASKLSDKEHTDEEVGVGKQPSSKKKEPKGLSFNGIIEKYPSKDYYVSLTQLQDWLPREVKVLKKTGEKTSSGRDVYEDKPVVTFTEKGNVFIENKEGDKKEENLDLEKFTLSSIMSKLSGMGGKLVNKSWRKGKYNKVYEMPGGSFYGVTDDEDGLVVTVDIDSQGEGYNYFNEDGELSDLFNKR